MSRLRILYLLAPFLWIFPDCLAQNLVPNPGFERYIDCPNNASMFYLAEGWKAPSAGTTDFFHACAPQGAVGVPQNGMGYQYARSGNGYAGFYAFQMIVSYREYLQVKLKSPLKASLKYHVEFYVCLSDRIPIKLDNLGAYLSIVPPSSASAVLLYPSPVPQVRNPAGHYLADTLNWMKIEGEFIAKGGEQYLTIGNFDDDEHTHYHNEDTGSDQAYYYIDDVSVSMCMLDTDLGPDRLMCPGDSILLQASSPGANYRWQNGSTNASFLVKEPGLYWVDVQTISCAYRDSVRVEYPAYSSINLLSDTTLCPNHFLLLNAGILGGRVYRWQDGSTGPVYKVSSTGTYWVDVELATCSFRDTIEVRPMNLQSKLAKFSNLCQGQPVVLNASVQGNATYQWADGSTNPRLTVTKPGTYWVTIQVGSCSFKDWAQVDEVYPPPLFSSRVVNVCSGQNATLDPGLSNGPYRWQDGSTRPTLTVSEPGTYWVEFPWKGCIARDSVRVLYYEAPPISLPKQTLLCPGQTVLLDASKLKGPYHWQNGSTDPTLTVSEAGTYWVEVPWLDCLAKITSQVILHTAPTVDLGNDTTLCYGQTKLLSVQGDYASIRWQDGSTGQQYMVRQSGTYWVEIQDRITSCITRNTMHINSLDCWTSFFIPNVITPNGDKDNQKFVIEGINDHWNLEIFNRWGERVYRTSAYGNDWDAIGVESGIYYYCLLNHFSGQKFQGWIQVLR
jgi:gliding motility-associated-like protein